MVRLLIGTEGLTSHLICLHNNCRKSNDGDSPPQVLPPGSRMPLTGSTGRLTAAEFPPELTGEHPSFKYGRNVLRLLYGAFNEGSVACSAGAGVSGHNEVGCL